MDRNKGVGKPLFTARYNACDMSVLRQVQTGKGTTDRPRESQKLGVRNIGPAMERQL